MANSGLDKVNARSQLGFGVNGYAVRPLPGLARWIPHIDLGASMCIPSPRASGAHVHHDTSYGPTAAVLPQVNPLPSA